MSVSQMYVEEPITGEDTETGTEKYVSTSTANETWISKLIEENNQADIKIKDFNRQIRECYNTIGNVKESNDQNLTQLNEKLTRLIKEREKLLEEKLGRLAAEAETRIKSEKNEHTKHELETVRDIVSKQEKEIQKLHLLVMQNAKDYIDRQKEVDMQKKIDQKNVESKLSILTTRVEELTQQQRDREREMDKKINEFKQELIKTEDNLQKVLKLEQSHKKEQGLLQQQMKKFHTRSSVQEDEIGQKIKIFTEDSKFIRFLMEKSMLQTQQSKADFTATLEKQMDENKKCKLEVDATIQLLKKQSEANKQLRSDIYEMLEKWIEANADKLGPTEEVEKFRLHFTQNTQAVTVNTQSKESPQELIAKVDPGTLFHNMEIIAEYHTQFNSDEPFYLNWDKYGFRILIPEGSIPKGVVGTLDLYAIYSGPFRYPNDSSPVSATYFISLSHDLVKPAILEIQHCYIINRDNDAAQLTFASATTSVGPPYHFKPVNGGCFLPGRYGLIHLTSFSFLETLQWVTQSISRYIFGCSYAVLYFLIPVQSPMLWHVELYITKYTNAHFEYLIKQKQEKGEKPVHQDFQAFVLNQDENNVSIAVLPEEDNQDQKVELKKWNGARQVFGNNWEVIGSVTQVCVSSVLENLSPCIPIHIEWTSEDPPERCVFRIHLLGIAKPLSIPVIVPYRHQTMQSGSPDEEPRMKTLESNDLPDILRATNEVVDWFTLGIYLKVHYSNLKALKRDHYGDVNYCRQEMFMSWISSGNATWSVLVKVLRDDMTEVAVAEKIENKHLRK